MAKYTRLNKALRRLILEETGLCVLKSNDPRIEECAEALVKRKKSNIPARELVRMYRYHCQTLSIALKYSKANNLPIKIAALDNNVCSKQLERYNMQLKQLPQKINPS